MKIDRLMGIVIYLLNHGRTSAQSLSEEFEVSPRTIVRDLEALDRAGIPIQSFYGVEGGYHQMSGLRCRHGGLDGLMVPHLAQKNDIRGLPQGRAES